LIRRVRSSPVLLYAVVRLAGFVFSYLKRDKRIVSKEFVKFLRKEETERLIRPFRGPKGNAARHMPDHSTFNQR
jgi:hypothetical protein